MFYNVEAWMARYFGDFFQGSMFFFEVYLSLLHDV